MHVLLRYQRSPLAWGGGTSVSGTPTCAVMTCSVIRLPPRFILQEAPTAVAITAPPHLDENARDDADEGEATDDNGHNQHPCDLLPFATSGRWLGLGLGVAVR
mmetsp:Transcript_16678/g.43275  ORF Transcript_16678/g.43275 Transcript_16678/m.43275 type:complete len:103 (+) Transcript_16678:243-551(+)